MTYHEILTALNNLPNFSENCGTMSATDRSWLCDFRLRFASGEVPSVEDEERLCRLLQEWDDA